ncbi:MAG: hypothetical protein IKU43_08860 [Clostridia bacterium]|nr:hypothetical protein [Clostridia bacterium]
MKFNVGYQLLEDESLIDGIIAHKDDIYEVYFSFGDFPNGRNNQLKSEIFTPYEAQEKQLSDLEKLSKAGLHFNLLFNGNCYGKDSLSRAFFSKVGDTTDYLMRKIGINSVTVTSPVIAKFFKANFEELEVRASVNMEIGSVEGMDYISDVFDSYYMKREYNRDFGKIRELKKWCDDNGKKLFGLCNSGCLNNCSVHNFHDNLVAHESDISAMDNAYDFRGKCWEYLSKGDNAKYMIQRSNYIRPEDVHLYEGLFEALKLATRINASPIKVIHAYTSGRFYGGINEILEPNHSSVIAPNFLDNSKFPKDFAETVGNCSKDCQGCNYCTEVYNKILTKLNGGYIYADKQND